MSDAREAALAAVQLLVGGFLFGYFAQRLGLFRLDFGHGVIVDSVIFAVCLFVALTILALVVAWVVARYLLWRYSHLREYDVSIEELHGWEGEA